MKKSKKLKEKEQVTGEKVDLRYATLDELLGNPIRREYSFDSVDAYGKFLTQLDKNGLAAEAMKRQVIPCIERHLLIDKLLSVFRSKHFARPDLMRKGRVSAQDQPESLMTDVEKLTLRPKNKQPDKK